MAAPPTITVFDTVYDTNGKPLVSATVTCVLESTVETYAGGLITAQTQTTVTDSTGRFQFTVICNDLLSPANSVYTITIPAIARSYQIAPQSGNGSSQQTTASNVIVNTPAPLAPTTSNLTGPLTVAGLLTAQAGLAVTGNGTISGNLTVSGTFSPSSLTVHAGEPGIDTATPGALLIGDNTATSIELGAATTISAGGLTVAAGGAHVTGNSTVTGTLVVSALVTAQAGLTVVGTVTLPTASIADEALSENIALLNEANAFSLGQTMLGTAVPAGTLGYAQVVANQGTFTGTTDLTSLTVTVSVAAGRRIKITGQCVLSSSVTSDSAALLILEGVTTLQDANAQLGVTGQFGATCTAIVILTPTVGAHTYKLTAQRIAGSGNITMDASAPQPAFILVEDIGV